MSLTTQDFTFVRELVRTEMGLVLDESKQYLVETRLRPVVRARGLRDLGDLIGAARKGDTLVQGEVLAAMATNETSFFRDGHPWVTLREHLLPQLASARAGARTLRIWSAACSTGQEPYTLALLIAEDLPQLRSWHIDILATDLSEPVLERARNGVFSDLEVRRGLPTKLRDRWFHRQAGAWQIDPALRAMVRFQHMNLVQPWPSLPTFDLVLMRNVLIYFDIPTKQRILRQVRTKLAPDGALMLGASESTLNIDDRFTLEHLGRSVAYRPQGAPAAVNGHDTGTRPADGTRPAAGTRPAGAAAGSSGSAAGRSSAAARPASADRPSGAARPASPTRPSPPRHAPHRR